MHIDTFLASDKEGVEWVKHRHGTVFTTLGTAPATSPRRSSPGQGPDAQYQRHDAQVQRLVRRRYRQGHQRGERTRPSGPGGLLHLGGNTCWRQSTLIIPS